MKILQNNEMKLKFKKKKTCIQNGKIPKLL
jgi:hypothetical protein